LNGQKGGGPNKNAWNIEKKDLKAFMKESPPGI
jgi:hypothetical protein